MLLLLALCVVTAIQLTSSQSTYNINEEKNDVSSCGSAEQVLCQLVTAMSQMQTAMAQLQRDVAELKIANQHKGERHIKHLVTII